MDSMEAAHRSYGGEEAALPRSDARRRLIMRAAGVGACLLGMVAVASFGQSSRSVDLIQAGWGGGGPALRKGQQAVISASVRQDAQLEKMHEEWAEARESHMRKMIALRVTADKHEASKRAEERTAQAAKTALLAQERLYRKHVVASGGVASEGFASAPSAPLASLAAAPTIESAGRAAAASPHPAVTSRPAASSQTAASSQPAAAPAVDGEVGEVAYREVGAVGEVAYLRRHADKLERRAELRSRERAARASYRRVLALSGHLKFTARRHKFNKDSLSCKP